MRNFTKKNYLQYFSNILQNNTFGSQISLLWVEIRLKTLRHQESTCINSFLQSEVNFEFDYEE
jgi:hypothetical protein